MGQDSRAPAGDQAGAIALGEAIRMVAHDLSSPLQTLKLLLELTLDDLAEAGELRESVGKSLAASESISHQVRELSEVARSLDPSGKSPHDCAAVIGRLARFTGRKMERVGIRMEVDLGPAAPVAVPSAEIELALLTLLLGAIHAMTKSDSPSATVSIRGSSENGSVHLVVSLSADFGFPADYLDRTHALLDRVEPGLMLESNHTVKIAFPLERNLA